MNLKIYIHILINRNRVLVLINASAGAKNNNEFTSEKIKEEFKNNNVFADIVDSSLIYSKNDLSNLLRKQKYDAVIAAGGDGTVNHIINILDDNMMPIGILPAGTLNHFAKDNNIPLTLQDSVKLITCGEVNEVDTAMLNDIIFVNNSSIGIYPLAVKVREQEKSRFAGNKWLSLLYGSIKVLIKFPLYTVNIKLKNDIESYKSVFVLVGNNKYELDIFSLGQRNSLKQGVLSLYAAKCTSRWSFIRLIFMTVFSRVKLSDDLDKKLIKELTIEANKKKISVSLDGEVKEMNTPLHYKVCPRNLKLISPVK